MPKPIHGQTWDGKPISATPPYGATIIVFRIVEGRHEFLVLHRAIKDIDDHDDWAWTPPSGARYPGEPMGDCARRELYEETGLLATIQRVSDNEQDWWVYMAEANVADQIHLSAEHDRYDWVNLSDASKMCQPDYVGSVFGFVAQKIGL